MSRATSRIVRAVGECIALTGVPSARETLVAGLSGGPDSVALVDALLGLGQKRGFSIVAAHLDHRLRPDSHEDASFCVDLCRRLSVRLEAGEADVAARARKTHCGIEEAARAERYAFLRQIKARVGAVAIAVAHTQDDQAETFLLRLLRGAGRPGLAAMRPHNLDVLRPLLSASREDVLEHLRLRRLPWLEDSSNRDLRYLRNRIRHELLPYLETRFNPRLRRTLARTAAQLDGEEDLLDGLVEPFLDESSRASGNGIVISLEALREAPCALARMALRRALARSGGLRGVSSAHVHGLLDVARCHQSSGKQLHLPGGRRALFRFGEVYLGPRSEPRAPFSFPFPVPGLVHAPGGLSFRSRACSRNETAGPTATVLAVREDERLEVRTRRPGDRIHYHGRSVSLRRYLMQQRVPADVRDTLPLVAVSDRVLWVPGLTGESSDSGHGQRFVLVEARGLEKMDPVEIPKRRTA